MFSRRKRYVSGRKRAERMKKRQNFYRALKIAVAFTFIVTFFLAIAFYMFKQFDACVVCFIISFLCTVPLGLWINPIDKHLGI